MDRNPAEFQDTSDQDKNQAGDNQESSWTLLYITIGAYNRELDNTEDLQDVDSGKG